MNKKGHVLNAVLLSLGLGVILSVDLGSAVSTADVERAAASIAGLFLPVVLGALAPDIDTAFGRHRKTFHNLALLGLFLAYPYFYGNLQFVWIGVATHYILDIVGSRRGIALFYPLSSREYGLPSGVTTSSRYADIVTIGVTAAELGALAAVHYFLIDLETGLVDATLAFVQ